MDGLQNFLKPRRKQNSKFVLSPAFCGEDGQPLEWELRELTAREALKVQRRAEGRPTHEALLADLAEALVVPDLRDAALLQGLSEREGRTILEPCEALIALLTENELTQLVTRWRRFNEMDVSLGTLAQQAKN